MLITGSSVCVAKIKYNKSTPLLCDIVYIDALILLTESGINGIFRDCQMQREAICTVALWGGGGGRKGKVLKIEFNTNQSLRSHRDIF